MVVSRQGRERWCAPVVALAFMWGGLATGCTFEGDGVRPVDAPPVVVDAPLPVIDAATPDAEPPPDAPVALCDGPVHLLLSEVAAGSEGEFIEICNPAPCVADLGHYFVTDAEGYRDIAAGTNPSAIVSNVEFIAQLPTGHTIGGDQRIAVLALDGAMFEATYSDFTRGDGLFVLKNRGVLGTDVNPAGSTSGNNDSLLANVDDAVFLFWWDGDNEVIDIDVMAYCSDGGDNGCREVMHDGGKAVDAVFNGNSQSHRRIAKELENETTTGGPDLDGHDERTEDLTKTWDNEINGEYDDSPTPGNPFDGVCAP